MALTISDMFHGKTLEYGQLSELPVSNRTRLESKVSSVTGALLHLTKIGQGWTCAGSASLWTDERFLSGYELRDGTKGGQIFVGLEDARAHFNARS